MDGGVQVLLFIVFVRRRGLTGPWARSLSVILFLFRIWAELIDLISQLEGPEEEECGEDTEEDIVQRDGEHHGDSGPACCDGQEEHDQHGQFGND